MLPRKTLFVVGAGAGYDLRMPLGEELSAEIAKKTDIRFEFSKRQSGDPAIVEALQRIAKERNEDFNSLRRAGCLIKGGITYSRSIDSFLNNHQEKEHLKTCAKLALALTILERESTSILYVDPSKHPKSFRSAAEVKASWLSDFMYVLQEGVVASENLRDVFKNLTIINFNYDRCIEHFLFYALQSTFLITAEKAEELMTTLSIYHPYGVVGYLGSRPGRRSVEFGVTDYGDLVGLSAEIKTFNETIEEGEELAAMREQVSAAEQIVFLGFHFHPQNMRLLSSIGPGRGSSVQCYATALNRSEADKRLLDREIRQMLAARGGIWDIYIERDRDCKKLFHEYQSTWLS